MACADDRSAPAATENLVEPATVGVHASVGVGGPTLLTTRVRSMAALSKPGPVVIGKELDAEVEVEQAGSFQKQRAPVQESDGEAEEYEEDVSAKWRRAAEEKATRDEMFWTAAAKALNERERRERVGAFLKEHGFSGVNRQKGWWNYTFPLHVAAQLGDLRLVELLLCSGVSRRLRDSSGRTARQVAKLANLWHSHDAIIKVLTRERRHKRLQFYRPATQEAAVPQESSTSIASATASASEIAHPSSATPPCEPSVAVFPARAGVVHDACTQCDLGAGADEGEEAEQP